MCECCTDKKGYKSKLFKGRFLNVEQAVEPSLILWENLGITSFKRCLRISISTLVAIVLLIITTLLILYVKI